MERKSVKRPTGKYWPMAIRLSHRQAEILGLVAEGLSDKQIAIRLRCSARTIRTHLERLFEKHGFHSRAEAVNACLGAAGAWHRQRSDECPHSRPFPEQFEGCPAYQRR